MPCRGKPSHPLAPIIRKYLLMILAIPFGIYAPDWFLGLLPMLFMPPGVLTHSGCICTEHDQIQVTISGVTSSSAQCGDSCAGYNSTFVVTYTSGPSFGVCNWGITSLSFCTGTGQTVTRLGIATNSGSSAVTVAFSDATPTGYLNYTQVVAGCNFAVSTSVAFLTNNSSTDCDGTHSSCHVIAL